MQRKLPSLFRVAIFLTSLVMFTVLGLPIWKIELSAPQYPEGLTLKIFADRIGGDVDIVNGLNHYIGMHTLHTRDFVEFAVLPYIIGGFAVLGLLVALIGRRKVFYGWAILFLLIAFTSMIDFYRWEYNYGHNLDPEAPIQVPGMAYQPPLIGFKQLLNFGAYSIPDTGGWAFVGAGIAIVTLVILDWRGIGRRRRVSNAAAGLVLVFLCGSLQGCNSGPQPIQYGQDDCAYCKMTFTDRRFGGEVCTKKGKVFKFDDLHCLLESLKAGVPARQEIGSIYLIDFENGGWISTEDALLLESPAFRSPMGGNIAAFAHKEALHHSQQQNNGQPVIWKELYH
ncbi:MAG TPA: nitrous oxide reductase accessory protein NosL [Puia sp.]|nr:nitrous oxide reductase accessory protein NosL [Puia sp.]